ncbi:MAG: AAA family ATPase, partial [Candidatus Margulisbacteria bacterium]|nr:AAA family ATPase [Candidatus Margulisiibacteriota bacterium]
MITMKREIDAQLDQWRESQNRKPLIVRGARQVGKTYALKAFGERSFKEYHYINFEKDKE